MFALLGGYCHFKCCSFDGPANENVVHFGLFSFILPGSPSCNSTQISIQTLAHSLAQYTTLILTDQPTEQNERANEHRTNERNEEREKNEQAN